MNRGCYQRKYGATDQINKILGELDQKKITNYHQGAVNELRFLPFSIHYLLSKLIDIAILPNNPYLSIYLPAYVEDFERATGKTLAYSIEQIVEEGYLILRGKEWALNVRYHNYERISEYESGKQKILIDFLKYLVDSVDTEKLQIQVEKEQLEELLASCDVSIEWMVEKELLICDQEKIYMNTFNWIWEKYGNAVLSNKYNEWMEKCGENQEQLQASQEKWIYLCGFFQRCWRPETEVKNMEGLYEYCLKNLESETGTWQGELRNTLKVMQIETGDLRKKYSEEIPQKGAVRQFFTL